MKSILNELKIEKCGHIEKTEGRKFEYDTCYIGKAIQILYDNIEKLGFDPKFVSCIEINHIDVTPAIANEQKKVCFKELSKDTH